MPDAFIPVAERSGLIVALGNWVLREACRQMREWNNAGIAPPLVGVNVSGLQFKSPLELENYIASTLAEMGLTPGHLELELTESALMQVSSEHNDVLVRLRKSGVRIAIDDFGSGYSSLEYLAHFTVDRIKIAQSFTRHIMTNSRDATIVKAAIRLAHDLGLCVVVEGVETQAEIELIRSWSARQVQGFYFSTPLPAPEMTEMLRAKGVGVTRAGTLLGSL
jgi:EAL domain-containing protein (putative c-di-GMP-specific phosphodiesterase class I)